MGESKASFGIALCITVSGMALYRTRLEEFAERLWSKRGSSAWV